MTLEVRVREQTPNLLLKYRHSRTVTHFGVIARRLASLLVSLVVMVSIAGHAQAAELTSGRWDSHSLRDNGIGYFLTMSPGKSVESSYSGMIRFEYRDGRKGPRMPFVATVRDDKLVMRAKQGRFDRGSGVLRGELSEDGSTLTFTNCQARLRLVMARALDSDCVFKRATTN